MGARWVVVRSLHEESCARVRACPPYLPRWRFGSATRCCLPGAPRAGVERVGEHGASKFYSSARSRAGAVGPRLCHAPTPITRWQAGTARAGSLSWPSSFIRLAFAALFYGRDGRRVRARCGAAVGRRAKSLGALPYVSEFLMPQVPSG